MIARSKRTDNKICVVVKNLERTRRIKFTQLNTGKSIFIPYSTHRGVQEVAWDLFNRCQQIESWSLLLDKNYNTKTFYFVCESIYNFWDICIITEIKERYAELTNGAKQ